MNFVTESQSYRNITATTTVSSQPGNLLGIFVSSASSSPTITVSDGAGTLVAQFIPVSATFYPMPARFGSSLIVAIGGTVNCTVFWT